VFVELRLKALKGEITETKKKI